VNFLPKLSDVSASNSLETPRNFMHEDAHIQQYNQQLAQKDARTVQKLYESCQEKSARPCENLQNSSHFCIASDGLRDGNDSAPVT